MTYLQLLEALDQAQQWSKRYDMLRELKNRKFSLASECAKAEQEMAGLRILLSQEIEP